MIHTRHILGRADLPVRHAGAATRIRATLAALALRLGL
jgi:hypothetical protein